MDRSLVLSLRDKNTATIPDSLSSKIGSKLMRIQLLKLVKKKSTRAERRFAELLKSQHIPFRTKVLIEGHEVDFLIGDYVIEIDGHDQNVEKNKLIIKAGLIPFHLNSWDIGPHLKDWINKIYGKRSIIIRPTSDNSKS